MDVTRWQPIATAPKDGSPFLAEYRGEIALWRWFHDRFCLDVVWGHDTVAAKDLPLRWHQLPMKEDGGTWT